MDKQIIADTHADRKLASHNVIIAAYTQAARIMWNMQDASDRDIRARAWRVADGYHDRAIQGEDAGIRRYIECLPATLALEYATASALSTQTRVCRLHKERLYTRQDGRFAHTHRAGKYWWKCYGLNSQENGENWELRDNFCDADYDAMNDAHADALEEMPELRALNDDDDDETEFDRDAAGDDMELESYRRGY